MRRLIVSIFNTIVLLYFMTKMTNMKIILVPFLICSAAMASQCIAEILHQEKLANIFRIIYKKGFFIFWFGFLAIAMYKCIKDQEYGMVIYLFAFVLAGIWMLRKDKKDSNARFSVGAILAVGLVVIALLAGVFLLVMGFMRNEGGLIFGGAFFLMGGIAFVLGGLSVKGCFDNFKIDIVGLYFGIVFVIIGSGFFIMAYRSPATVPRLVLVIPALMTAAGILQVVKCIKNRV